MINCTFENGKPASLRHATVDALVVKDQKVLLVKRTSALVEAGKWALPGGYVDRDETLAAACRREVLEETGWEVSDPRPLMINSSPTRPGDDRQNITCVFSCTAVKQTGDSDWESDEVKWFPLDALPALSEMAFDHADFIALYLKTASQPGTLPVVI